MPQISHAWTPDEVRALPDDGRRYEVVAGELLVTPSPSFSHQEAVGEVFRLLSDYTKRTDVGHTSLSPADIEPEEGALVQPDVFVVHCPKDADLPAGPISAACCSPWKCSHHRQRARTAR